MTLNPLRRKRERAQAAAKELLARKRIRAHLDAYDEPTVERLEKTIQDLLKEQDGIAEVIDKKATTVLGFSGAFGGLLLPWLVTLPTSTSEWQINWWFYLLALATTGCAAWWSFAAFRAQSGWSAMRRDALFPDPAKAGFSPPRMRKFWVEGIHHMYEERADFCRRKGRSLLRGQAAIVCSIVLMGMATATRLYVYRAKPPPLRSTSNEITDVALDGGIVRLCEVINARPIVGLDGGLLHDYDDGGRVVGLVIRIGHHPPPCDHEPQTSAEWR